MVGCRGGSNTRVWWWCACVKIDVLRIVSSEVCVRVCVRE